MEFTCSTGEFLVYIPSALAGVAAKSDVASRSEEHSKIIVR